MTAWLLSGQKKESGHILVYARIAPKDRPMNGGGSTNETTFFFSANARRLEQGTAYEILRDLRTAV